MKQQGCPVCGYPHITVFDDDGNTTFEICPSCGCEAGYHYQPGSSAAHLEKHRRAWMVDRHCAWWDAPHKPPPGWDPIEQMRQAGIPIPA